MTHDDHAREPDLPYAGTSGWSGSAASLDRATTEDADGTTADRQTRTLTALDAAASDGLTWRELGALRGWHHGQASGVLSVLHKEGRIARLTERRNRCSVYVALDHVNGRDTAAHGRRPTEHPAVTAAVEKVTLTDPEKAAVARARVAVDRASDLGIARAAVSTVDLRTVMAALDRVTAP